MRKIININNTEFKVDTSTHPSHWEHVCSGIWEPFTFKIFDKFLNVDSSYIDIGAWIGTTVLYGAQLAKHVFAVEPDRVALDILNVNINLNKHLVDKITLFDGCLCDVDGSVNLAAKKFGDSVSSILGASNTKNAVVVKALKFDSFINKYNIYDCNFIKMDVEGAEIILIPSMFDYINSYKPTLYVSFHPWHFNDKLKSSMLKTLNIYNKFYDAKNMNRVDISKVFNLRELVCE